MDIIITIPLLIAITIGVTGVIKGMKMPSRALPLVALIIGVIAAFIAQIGTISMTILIGLIIGLSASGLWSGAKVTFARTNK